MQSSAQFWRFSPSGVLASPNCKHKSYSGMVAHTSCDLLAGVVVEEQEMDAIFPRSHLAVCPQMYHICVYIWSMWYIYHMYHTLPPGCAHMYHHMYLTSLTCVCAHTCTTHPPHVHTCTNASVPHLYAHTLYHCTTTCVCICICITTFICNRRTQFPHYTLSKEDHIIFFKKLQSSDQHLEQGQSSSAQCICDWCWTSVS